MTLAELNGLDRATFAATLGGIFEHSPWVADEAWAARPFASARELHSAMLAVVHAAGGERQLALLRAHPELAGKAALRGELTADSTREQSGAGISACSPEEYRRLHDLNARYNAKFGFPFILAVKGHDRASILSEFERRAGHDRETEFAECLAQVAKISGFRLDALLGS